MGLKVVGPTWRIAQPPPAELRRYTADEWRRLMAMLRRATAAERKRKAA